MPWIKFKKIFSLFTLVTLVFISGAFAEKENLAKFYEANFAYKEGEYAKAILVYEEVLQDGLESGSLYYNLGNSYFKDEKLGKAILNYERAKLFMPRDGDLVSNYQYARSLTDSRMLGLRKPFAVRVLQNYQNSFSCREIILF